MSEKSIYIKPLPGHPLEYVPGLGESGASLPEAEAQALIDAGLAAKSKPKSEPAIPAEPEE